MSYVFFVANNDIITQLIVTAVYDIEFWSKLEKIENGDCNAYGFCYATPTVWNSLRTELNVFLKQFEVSIKNTYILLISANV